MKTVVEQINDQLRRRQDEILDDLRFNPTCFPEVARKVEELSAIVGFLENVPALYDYAIRGGHRRLHAMTRSIDELGLTPRVRNKLHAAGVVCVCQLVDLGRNGLERLGIGRDSLRQIAEALDGVGEFLPACGRGDVVLVNRG